MKKLCILFLTLTMAANALAVIDFSADARVRPRLAQSASFDTNGDEQWSTSDMYWLYRARIFARSDLDGGFYWAAKLGHEGVADFSKMGTAATNQVDWMLAYFGRKTDTHSWMAGRIPCKSNVLMDLHFYPGSPVGIPFLLYHNLSLTGVKGSFNVGPGTLFALYSIDENNNFSETDSDGVTTNYDKSTFGGGYVFAVAGTKVAAQFLYTMGEDKGYDVYDDAGNLLYTEDFYNPMTYGAYVYPNIAGFNFSFGGGMTAEADDAYTGMAYHAGVKKALGPGVFNFFYDGASVEWDGASDPHSYMFLWLDYAVKYGPVTFKPTWRMKKCTNPDDSYTTTNFFELTTEIKVK